jgi:hypothetical protein
MASIITESFPLPADTLQEGSLRFLVFKKEKSGGRKDPEFYR